MTTSETEPDAPPPASLYSAPEGFAHERRAVFAEAWQMIGRAGQLARPGEYVCANLGGTPVFAIRAEGEVNAFRNVCRHQGLPVLENGAGRRDVLRCRYHGWTYDASGALVATPPMVAPAQPQSPDNHLQAIAVAVWRDLVFVNQRKDAPPPGAALDEVLGSTLPLEPSHYLGEVAIDLMYNWKIAIEAVLSEIKTQTEIYFPCLVAEPLVAGVIVHQIVPRNHLRSRVVRHVYAAADPEGALDAARQDAALLVARCAETMRRLAEPGSAPAPNGAIAAFRRRVAAALARAS